MTIDVGAEVGSDFWQTLAACRGSTVDFYPDQDDLRGILLAKRVCQGCIVRADCLEDAIIRREEYGIWGGTTQRDRSRMIRRTRK